MRLSSWFPCTTTLVFFWFLFDHRKFIDPEDRRSNTGFPLIFLHFSPFFTPPQFHMIPYLTIYPSPLTTFLFSSPPWLVLTSICFVRMPIFLVPLSSQFILFLPIVPPFSPHHLPISSSSTPCGLCPCLRITSVIRRWSSTLIIRVLMCFWSAILDQLSPLTSDIATTCLSLTSVSSLTYLQPRSDPDLPDLFFLQPDLRAVSLTGSPLFHQIINIRNIDCPKKLWRHIRRGTSKFPRLTISEFHFNL